MKSRYRIPALLVLLFALPSLSQSFPYQYEREVVVENAGWVRLLQDPAMREHMMPRGNDLRLLDPAGAEVPFDTLLAPARERSVEPRAVSVTETPEGWLLEFELSRTPPLHDALTFDLEASVTAPSCTLEASGDGKTWLFLARGNLFRIGEEGSLAQTRIEYDPTRLRRLRLGWPRSAGYPEVRRVRVREYLEDSPAELRVPLDFTEISREPGGAAYRIPIKGKGLRPERLLLAWSGSGTLAYRLHTPGDGTWNLLLEGALSLPEEGGPEPSIPLAGRDLSREPLLLELNAGGEAPIALEAIEADFEPSWIVFHAAGPGTYRLRYGGIGLAPPYHPPAKPAAPLESLPMVRPGPEQRGPAEAFRSPFPTEGAPMPDKPFAYSAHVSVSGVMAGTPVSIELPGRVYSQASRDLSDLRLESGGSQVPFVLWRPPDPALVREVAGFRPEPHDSRSSEIVMPLENPWLPFASLDLSTQALPFERPFTVSADIEAGPGRDPRIWTAPSGIWRCPGIHLLPCRTTVSMASWPYTRPLAEPRGTEAATTPLRIRFQDGDNPPLSSVSARLWRRRDVLVFLQPEAPVSLYWGAPGLQAPRYDLEKLREQLLALPSSPARLEETTSARAEKPAWSRFGLIAVLALTALLLVAILARMLRSPSEGAPS